MVVCLRGHFGPTVGGWNLGQKVSGYAHFYLFFWISGHFQQQLMAELGWALVIWTHIGYGHPLQWLWPLEEAILNRDTSNPYCHDLFFQNLSPFVVFQVADHYVLGGDRCQSSSRAWPLSTVTFGSVKALNFFWGLEAMIAASFIFIFGDRRRRWW